MKKTNFTTGSLRKSFAFVLLFLAEFCSGCKLSPSAAVNKFTLSDTKPPVMLEVYAQSEASVRLVFDEPVTPVPESFAPFEAAEDGYGIVIILNESLEAGESMKLSGRVEDKAGNSVTVSVEVWGYNPHPAGLLINEITTTGTDTSPHRTELLAIRSGNTAGTVLYNGIPEDRESFVVLPSIDVSEGDFIVVHWRKTLPKNTQEHPADNVWNICTGEDIKPSAKNGIQTLASSPSQGAKVTDCVIYSAQESELYEGYGKKAVYERVLKALENSWWKGEPVISKNATATRSMSRKLNTGDSDTASDWYTTETKGSTFGSANTSAPY